MNARPVPVRLRATLPACAWANRSEVKMTTGENAAISRTANPDAIQFSVVSLSVGETSELTTRRKPTYTTVATTNLERSRPMRNSDSVVAAFARRGQIDITLTKGTNEVMVRIRAERTTSSRCTITVRQQSVRAVTINPKVLTWAPPVAARAAASLAATWRSRVLVSLLKSADHAVASSSEYPAAYLTRPRPA